MLAGLFVLPPGGAVLGTGELILPLSSFLNTVGHRHCSLGRICVPMGSLLSRSKVMCFQKLGWHDKSSFYTIQNTLESSRALGRAPPRGAEARCKAYSYQAQLPGVGGVQRAPVLQVMQGPQTSELETCIFFFLPQ